MTQALQQKRAWNLYLATTKNLEGKKYESVEAWAWNRLEQRLDEVGMRSPGISSLGTEHGALSSSSPR